MTDEVQPLTDLQDGAVKPSRTGPKNEVFFSRRTFTLVNQCFETVLGHIQVERDARGAGHLRKV